MNDIIWLHAEYAKQTPKNDNIKFLENIYWQNNNFISIDDWDDYPDDDDDEEDTIDEDILF